uniref:HD/PDEase domain-containing protein n=1 Tax=Panagrolaimus sp. ES5 TaxID=591445 RepID=A0AC34FTR8_9BILA
MATFKKSILDDTPQARTPGTDGHEYSKLKVENKKTEKKRQKKPSDDPKEKKRKIDWDYENPDNFFDINLGEGIGIGSFPRICKPIMDNPIFRRLDNIKQLGAVNYVYPDGNHSRRSHSLGTAHLACKLVKKLQKQKINGIPPMTGSEMLCVVIGALCHDLGHGPFSHLCEEFMIQEDGTLLSHEEMSVLLFEKILNDYPESKACLDLYFEDYHFNLIKQLIDPPKNEQPWNFFVGPEKAFLFAIVNNSISGLDVDKMDYLLRDSKRVGVNGVTSENIDYCFSKAKICEIPSRPLCKKYKWISFPQTNPQVVSIFFERRQYLHEIVYSHRTVGAVSEMLREAIRLSLSEVKLSRGTKIDVPLEHCFRKENLDLYIMLTDEYLRTQVSFNNIV